MKKMMIALYMFDLVGFVNEIYTYLKGFLMDGVEPSSAITWVMAPGDAPNYGPERGWDVVGELKQGHKMIFFPFGMIDEDGHLFTADKTSIQIDHEQIDDGDPDSEDAHDGCIRRPRCFGHRRDAGRSQPDPYQALPGGGETPAACPAAR